MLNLEVVSKLMEVVEGKLTVDSEYMNEAEVQELKKLQEELVKEKTDLEDKQKYEKLNSRLYDEMEIKMGDVTDLESLYYDEAINMEQCLRDMKPALEAAKEARGNFFSCPEYQKEMCGEDVQFGGEDLRLFQGLLEMRIAEVEEENYADPRHKQEILWELCESRDRVNKKLQEAGMDPMYQE